MKFKKASNCKNMLDDKNQIFSKKIFDSEFYFATIILFQSTQYFYEKREGYGSGSLSLVTKGSKCGSWRPQNIRIRIPNTGVRTIQTNSPVKCSVADPGCLSRIRLFSIPVPHQRI
jgi:hypothetical protein